MALIAVLLIFCFGCMVCLSLALSLAVGAPVNPFRALRQRWYGTMLLEHFRALVRLRLPLVEALEAQPSEPAFVRYRDFHRVHEQLRHGMLLGDAMAWDAPITRAPQWLLRLEAALRIMPRIGLVTPAEAEVLRIGERSGNLAHAIEVVLSERRRLTALRFNAWPEFIYPSFVVIVMFGLVWGLAVFIAPKMKDMARELGYGSRGMDRIVSLATAAPLLYIGFFLTGGTAYIFFKWVLTSRRSVSPLDRESHARTPLGLSFRSRRAELAEFCRELGMLLSVHVPCERALRVLAEGTMRGDFRRRIARSADLCARGETLGRALDLAKIDSRIVWACSAASGGPALSSALDSLADDFNARAFWQWSAMLRLVPPLLIVMLGGVVAIVALAFFGTILQMTISYL